MPPLTRLLTAFAVLLAGAAPGAAQDKLYRSADAVAGKTTRLAIFANVSKECTTGPLPEIKVATPPKHGLLAVKSGKVKPGTLARCPKLEVPVQGVFYQANPKYAGADEISVEIKRADGRSQSLTIKITVSEKPSPKAQDSTDL